MMDQDFDPRTPYGVRLVHRLCGQQGQAISIHAPHAGCDRPNTPISTSLSNFNPRTPYGVRPSCSWLDECVFKFQSTHPIRGATRNVIRISRHGYNFNPRTPYGVRLNTFQRKCSLIHISIHAPHTGCDVFALLQLGQSRHFNPRTPYGVRPDVPQTYDSIDIFQSTHPIRGATCVRSSSQRLHVISIHAPARGATFPLSLSFGADDDFNPRTREGCDKTHASTAATMIHFNPRTREGCDYSAFHVGGAP